MTTRIITADEAKELLDSANDFTLVDPGYHCGGSFVECSLASDCGGDHPTGRLSALQIDAGEESETLCFSSAKDARLAAAAPDLAATVVAQAAEIERLRAIVDGRTTPPTDEERLVEEGAERAEPYACADPRCGCAASTVAEVA